MHIFEFYENDRTEANFRSSYDDIQEEAQRCWSGMGGNDQCAQMCHYLLSDDIEIVAATGYPAVFGINCDAAVICWGGDIDDVNTEVYCKDCADGQRRYRMEQEERSRLKVEIEQRDRSGNEQEKRKQNDYWLNLSCMDFERQCAQLFRDLGFEADTTPASHDGGVDIVLSKDGKRGAVQCKAWSHPCGVKEVREFYGAICGENMEFGYFIARSGFTTRAKLFFEKMTIIQGWDTEGLVERASDNLGDRNN